MSTPVRKPPVDVGSAMAQFGRCRHRGVMLDLPTATTEAFSWPTPAMLAATGDRRPHCPAFMPAGSRGIAAGARGSAEPRSRICVGAIVAPWSDLDPHSGSEPDLDDAASASEEQSSSGASLSDLDPHSGSETDIAHRRSRSRSA